jgi:hypothetical protein
MLIPLPREIEPGLDFDNTILGPIDAAADLEAYLQLVVRESGIKFIKEALHVTTDERNHRQNPVGGYRLLQGR